MKKDEVINLMSEWLQSTEAVEAFQVHLERMKVKVGNGTKKTIKNCFEIIGKAAEEIAQDC